MKIKLEDFEAIVSYQISRNFKRDEMALTYAFALTSPSKTNWKRLDQLIVDHWSQSGLEHIQREAVAILGPMMPSTRKESVMIGREHGLSTYLNSIKNVIDYLGDEVVFDNLDPEPLGDLAKVLADEDIATIKELKTRLKIKY